MDDPLILEDFFHVQLTPQNARKAFTILNLAFKAAMRGRLDLDRRIPSNPCDFQQLAPLETAARGVPSADEVAKILIAASEQGDLWDLYCRLTATLGTRRGETCAFRVDDFDIRHRRVHVDETPVISPDGGMVLKPPKSWESRTLHIPHDPFWKAIQPYVAHRPPRAFLFSGRWHWVVSPRLRGGEPAMRWSEHTYSPIE